MSGRQPPYPVMQEISQDCMGLRRGPLGDGTIRNRPGLRPGGGRGLAVVRGELPIPALGAVVTNMPARIALSTRNETHVTV
jgi:hypothetical protein